MIVEKDKQQPLVSICIPTYNGAAYLETAVRSALSQAALQGAGRKGK